MPPKRSCAARPGWSTRANERTAAESALGDLRSAATSAAEAHAQATRTAADALATLEAAGTARDTAQEAADATRRVVIELTERLQATRAELAALAEPHDAASRLGRRLSAAGWPTLLDAVSAPEDSWPAIEAVVGGELESALLWADGDPTAEISDARGAARLLAADDGPTDDGRSRALAAVGGERTLAEWIGMAAAPRVFARTVLAKDLDALLAGWRRLPVGWAAVTAAGDLGDARGIVIRGRGDPTGGTAARAHARRRELGHAVAELETRFAEAQRAAHTAAEGLRAARTEHLGAREAQEEAERAARGARDARLAADDAVERAEERIAALDGDLAALRAAESEPQSAGGAEVEPDMLAARQAAAEETRSRRDALATRRDEAREAWTLTRRAAEEVETRTAGLRGGRAANEARVAQLRAGIPERRAAIAAVAAERATLTADHERRQGSSCQGRCGQPPGRGVSSRSACRAHGPRTGAGWGRRAPR